MSDTAFEVYGRGFGWCWRLRDGSEPVAHCGSHYDRSKDARMAVDRVRSAVGESDTAATFAGPAVRSAAFVTERYPDAAGEYAADGHDWVWRLETDDETLAHSAQQYPSEDAARESITRFVAVAKGALPVFMVGAEHDWQADPDPVRVGLPSIRELLSELSRGRRHREALDRFDTRIVVSGSRGKSSTTRRLDDVFNRRGYDTFTKITGNYPVIIHNGEVYPISRLGPRTTLYENINVIGEFAPELDAYAPDDIGIFENQAITEYTTGLVNRTFVDPDVLVLTNVRNDHNDTLGRRRQDIARSLARAVPADTHVISGEQHPAIHDYMREELEHRGATIEQVEVPPRHADLIGAETVHAIDAVLEWLGEDPLPAGELDAYLDAMQPEWSRVPGGRVYNAAEVNDVESTELVRRALTEDDEQILPFVYLRIDRRGRTASFAEYVNLLAERDCIDRVRVGGAETGAFARAVDVPTTQHPPDDDAGVVLDEMLAEGDPVVLMGNTVDDFMRDMEGAIAERIVAYRDTTVAEGADSVAAVPSHTVLDSTDS
ncbi:Mur ligase family CapB protein [Haloferax prahovense DSM 18310]|uniref:Mur ligase family CapB protein n=1 Tax=Haloferax prahovense (strain DSM 18310 / JCM 13924 / TL6) TaxID=1227461 RepID=M0GAT8_HALPT|nr:Mur ligase family CapB protein [Haloferax prahovense]ELZ69335.1 Mur ligase family CapB protein [Haloferax prahovense DSM 18310]